jgi:hypothetical protein
VITLGEPEHLRTGDQDTAAPLDELDGAKSDAVVKVAQGHREESAGFLFRVEQTEDLLGCSGMQFGA